MKADTGNPGCPRTGLSIPIGFLTNLCPVPSAPQPPGGGEHPLLWNRALHGTMQQPARARRVGIPTMRPAVAKRRRRRSFLPGKRIESQALAMGPAPCCQGLSIRITECGTGNNMPMAVTIVTILQVAPKKRSLCGRDKVPVPYGTSKLASCGTGGIIQPACGRQSGWYSDKCQTKNTLTFFARSNHRNVVSHIDPMESGGRFVNGHS